MKKLATLLMLLPMLALADVSLYRGLATTHLFSNNGELNNDNGVTILKAGDFLAGYMTNSFNEQGYQSVTSLKYGRVATGKPTQD